MNGTALYERTVAFDYGDQKRNDLMRKVWSVTPFMTDCFTDSMDTTRYREIREWCSEKWGIEASPIHGKSGQWQRGSATVYGWTWFGFKTSDLLAEFQAKWECCDAVH